MARSLWLAAALALVPTAASSQMNSADLKWGPAPPGLPKGAKLAVLSGNPGKEGLFTIRLRMPAGYSVAAHHHPTDELVTVLSGNLSLGMGDKLNRKKAATLAPAGYLVAPANMNHYAFTRTGATIQISGQGPFEIVYVNPKDDPRRPR